MSNQNKNQDFFWYLLWNGFHHSHSLSITLKSFARIYWLKVEKPPNMDYETKNFLYEIFVISKQVIEMGLGRVVFICLNLALWLTLDSSQKTNSNNSSDVCNLSNADKSHFNNLLPPINMETDLQSIVLTVWKYAPTWGR